MCQRQHRQPRGPAGVRPGLLALQVLLDVNERKWCCGSEVAGCTLQGKYINDPEVLREAAHAAGVEGYEKVLSDPMHAMDQVCTFTSYIVHRDCWC